MTAKVREINIHNIIGYFILIPFLNPRGFYDAVPFYKPFMTAWVYLALLLIIFEMCLQYRGNLIHMEKRAEIAIFSYFAAVILITLTAQGGLHEGLQNMIATPFLCVYAILCLRNDPKHFIKMISNILIVLFLLNLTIFNPYIMQYKIAEYHIIFLGHIQVAAQFGVLGILCGALAFRSRKKTALLLELLSILTMLTSNAASAILIVVLLVVFIVLVIFKVYGIFCKGIPIYIVLYTIFSAILVMVNVRLPGFVISMLNSRQSIWAVALQHIKEAPVIGYGVQGVTLELYWGGKFNYAHSQFAQNLLDGGIVLSILFFVMFVAVAFCVRKTENKILRSIGTLTMIAFMCVALFDSVSFYPYFMLTLMILLYLPDISKIQSRT